MRRFFDFRLLVLAALLSAAASLPFLSTAKVWRDLYFFDVTLTSSADGHTQIFWDLGQGINETDSSFQPLRASAKPVRYRFMLPTGTFKQLRFDVTDRAGSKLTISQAEIVDWKKKVIAHFPPSAFKATKDIEKFEVQKDTLVLETKAEADDPELEMVLASPLTLPLEAGPQFYRVVPIAVSVFVLSLLLGQGFVWVFRSPQAPSDFRGRLGTSPTHHSCRGDFGGDRANASRAILRRSFVSPSNGSLMLYGDQPTLPGITRTDYEDGMGSDVGALLFQHLYYPMVQHEAIFEHGEWPLWNRYSLSGIPSMGQGQSMFGDPFNFITICANGSAWAWDARFIIARWLLCAGLGLTAFMLTRHLRASLLVAVGAGFLGFFTFRLNHPANFSVCYSPWLVWAWVGLIQATTSRKQIAWSGALILANWILMTSGTAKEAYMSMACLNVAGVLLLFVDSATRGRRILVLGLASAAGLIFIFLSAPLWMSFLTALKHSVTGYDIPQANPADPRQFIGFFEEIFYRQDRSDEGSLAPSLNFLFFIGFLWTLASPQLWSKNRAALGLLAASAFSFAFAFGIIPASIVTKIPFVANVIHTGNTFSCPLMITVALLAAFGFREAIESVREPFWWKRYFSVLLLGGLLALSFFHATSGLPKSPFFTGYSAELALAALALPLGWRWAVDANRVALGYTALLLCFPLLLWRHSQHLKTPFDRYVFNPAERADFRASSPAVALINASQKDVGRVVGFEGNVFPAYNTVWKWESLYGVDALKSHYYHEFCSAGNLERVWLWDKGTSEKDSSQVVPVHDLLNVTYYLATHKTGAHQLERLQLLKQTDLDVYESPTVWPRAFFTDRVYAYSAPREIIRRLSSANHAPFAALDRDDEHLSEEVSSLFRTRSADTVSPAHDYKLTTNNTSFTVEAPHAGIIVLTESYYAGDFRVTLNGQPVDYFRVNHAFKGLYVPSQGTYRVEFAYWPEHFTLALILSAIGGLTLLLGAWLGPRFLPKNFLGTAAT